MLGIFIKGWFVEKGIFLVYCFRENLLVMKLVYDFILVGYLGI